jgi:hypothetical protein
MTKTIIVNSSHFESGSGNRFVYNFPIQQNFKLGDKMALVKCSIYNCVYNISSNRGNNTLSIKWINDVVYNYIIPDGYYSVSDLNFFLSNAMFIDKLYTIPSTSTGSSESYTVYLFLTTNDTAYGTTFVFIPLPTDSNASSTGTTIPSGATWSFLSTSKCPQITLSSGLQTLLGMTQNTILPVNRNISTDEVINSISTPTVSPINTYIFTCSLFDNPLSEHPNAFHSVSLGEKSFGEQIQDSVSVPVYNEIKTGTYNNFKIEVFDQSFSPVKLLDKEAVFQFDFIKANN